MKKHNNGKFRVRLEIIVNSSLTLILTIEETEQNIRESIAFHIDGLKEEGYDIPQPTSRSSYVEIAA